MGAGFSIRTWTFPNFIPHPPMKRGYRPPPRESCRKPPPRCRQLADPGFTGTRWKAPPGGCGQAADGTLPSCPGRVPA